MNFLAHLYLSGENKPLRIGNFIADHVKGKTIKLLPEEIAQGVILHRKIDFYTDNHPVVASTKDRLRPIFRKYAGVVADVYFDHFLAIHWDRYSALPLNKYAQDFYEETKEFSSFLPLRTTQMLPYMIANNWLVSYASIEGIGKVLTGMSRRTTFESNMENGANELSGNYSHYENDFKNFFPDLIAYTKSEIPR